MSDQSTIYPNINWEQFAVCNDDRTGAFEEMCRDLFYCEYLHEKSNPHSDHNNPGVEVNPILEPIRDDKKPQKFISFQAKYFERSISDSKIIESLKQAVRHYNGRLGRIYLFCNRVISKNTKRYKKYQAILADADIELELVTDKDIFTLLRKHKRVVDYYFQDRKRTAERSGGLIGNSSVLSSVTDGDIATNNDNTGINPFLHNLIKDRLQKCKEAIFDLDFGVLKKELAPISTAVETDKMIAYYQFLLAVHDGDKFESIIDLIPCDLKEEVYWLKNLCKNPRDIIFDEIESFYPESKIITLIIIFSVQRWNNILDIYQYRSRFETDILKALDFHYALALFNLRREDEAHEVLSVLFSQYHDNRFELYDICARLNLTNRTYLFGKTDHGEEIKELLTDLDRVKTQSGNQLKSNGNLFATIELQSCFNLAVTEKRYVDEAARRYEGFPDSIKKYEGVRFFMALCYEIGGDLDKACELLSQCSWRDEEGVSERYLTLLVDSGQPELAINAYNEITEKTSRVESVYLLALSRINDEKYENMLKEAVDKHSASLDDLFIYGFYVENKDVFCRIVLPRLEKCLAKNIDDVDLQIKVGLLAIFSRNGEIELIEKVLKSISDLNCITPYVVHDIYKCLFEVIHKKYETCKHDKETDKEIYHVEKIANSFYENDILKVDFLKIKVMCSSVSNMEISMLKYSKELFANTHDIHIAQNIITLLYKRNETRKEEYEPYLETLMESDDPHISITVSLALWKLGRYDEADFYVYKALYNLNGKDDFDVYKGIFVYHNLNMQRMKYLPKSKTVSGNMIVTLKYDDGTRIIALDSEADFCDKDNCSLGVEHISKQDQIYNKLLGSGKNQILNLRGRSYKVIDFEPREIAINRFIFQKVTENPDKFNVHTISTKNPEEMVRQLLALSDKRNHIRKLTESYNFKNSQFGIPIDYFVSGNYEKYIDVVQYLLYSKDLAYYAGFPMIESVIDAKYIIPTLSTLVLLAYHNWLDVLDPFEDLIIIPESYIEFFREQYAAELGTQSVSEGALIPLEDGKCTILKRDKKIPEIWERIIEKCELYTTTAVTDEERIEFEIFKGYTWERFFCKINIDKMQLDGLIVAEREEGVYLCDDLFFRKIATMKNIKNINFATLLYVSDNIDKVMPVIMDLSKTNYIYTAVRSRNINEWNQLTENLLDGKLKNVYYSEFFNIYLNAFNQVMRENFGENCSYEAGDDGESKT